VSKILRRIRAHGAHTSPSRATVWPASSWGWMN